MYKEQNNDVLEFQQKKKYKNLLSYFLPKQKIELVSRISSDDLFGIPLVDASKIGSILWDLKVPDPVALCFSEICKRGLDAEGIFRLSGSTSEVLLLENKINKSTAEERKSIDLSNFDIHTLTSLVKKYLRELPEPVIPSMFHKRFQKIITEEKTLSLEGLTQLISRMPLYNRQLFHAILLLASRIQHHVDKNKMCPEALATVFAPVCTGFEKSLSEQMNDPYFLVHHKTNNFQKSARMIEQHIEKNKNWTLLWQKMIEQNESLIASLDKQLYQYQYAKDSSHRKKFFSCPSSSPPPFSSYSSSVSPFLTDELPKCFYSVSEDTKTIPVAKPIANPFIRKENKKSDKSISKKSSFFRQKSSSSKKLLSSITLR